MKNFYQDDSYVFMTRPASNFKALNQNHLKDNFEINDLSIQSTDDLYNCFYQAFITRKDCSFTGRNKIQRRSMFDVIFEDSINLNTEVSLVLTKNHLVIDLTVFLTRPFIGDEHLALICIHPDFQGENLGQPLLLVSMVKLDEQGKNLVSLGVELNNQAAYRVYQKLGFEPQTKCITHVWQDETVLFYILGERWINNSG